jgi:hypothetical protein
MIGEFHKNNNASGLHNSSFYPLRMPCPALAIRHMVAGDLVFLKNSKKYSEETVVQFLRDFIRHMGDKSEARASVEDAEQALARAKQV